MLFGVSSFVYLHYCTVRAHQYGASGHLVHIAVVAGYMQVAGVVDSSAIGQYPFVAAIVVCDAVNFLAAHERIASGRKIYVIVLRSGIA